MDEANPRFPPIDQALNDPDGLLAAGGQLDVATLLLAYRQGIFPWYEDPQSILWWSPSRRAVLRPGAEHVSRSMTKLIRKGDHRVTSNQRFADVIDQCAAPRAGTGGTWITPAIKDAYQELHRRGIAHSVECWRGEQLVGGLYGVQVGAIFCGESMFSRESNASKLAFIALSRTLAARNFQLIDCQLENPHLISLGIEMISRKFFAGALAKYRDVAIHWPESDAFQLYLSRPDD